MLFAPLLTPGKLSLARGCASLAAPEAARLGTRAALIHSASVAPALRDTLLADLRAHGLAVTSLPSSGEPDLPGLMAARATLAPFAPDVILALGGGATIDLAKALAALLPASGDLIRHFEVVGAALPLDAPPLPLIALPTTAGTGAEATKNAVIAIPSHRVKVSLRDDRMMPAVALVDPALTDHCPRAVTLASGLDALTQVIEPYLCTRATPFTDALCRDAIPAALPALMRLMQAEDQAARDTMARVSLFGGLALANAGLGAVHGFAGPLGGQIGAPHGVICGRLLPEVLAENRAALPAGHPTLSRFAEVERWLAAALEASDGIEALRAWINAQNLPRLGALGLTEAGFPAAITAARQASSMKANPVALSDGQLVAILTRAL